MAVAVCGTFHYLFRNQICAWSIIICINTSSSVTLHDTSAWKKKSVIYFIHEQLLHVITLSILTYSTTSTRFTSPFNIYVFSHQDRIPLPPKMFHQLSIDSSLLWCICCSTTCDYWRLEVFLCLCLATTPPSNENIQSPCAFPLPQDSSLPTNVSSEHTFWTIQCALLHRDKRSDQLNSNHSIDLPSWPHHQ